MINIVIPMAGRGSRFVEAGYELPKPLIPIHGIPMIRLVIENLMPGQAHRFVFVCQRAHVSEYGLRGKLARWAPGCEIVELDGVTEGAACTVLHAAELIDDDRPLMIANSDQYLDTDINAYLNFCARPGLDGCIMTMVAHDPKWSFARLDARGLVVEVAEKRPISDQATTGVYNFKKGREFIAAARRMIAADKRVNGEFYVAPVYNELLADGARIGAYSIGAEVQGMHGLGIPDDLVRFTRLPLSQRVCAAAE